MGTETPAVVGRFAPTPSGRIHLGNVFAALLAWLSARSQGGLMLLRIEDLDAARCKPEYTALLLEDLRWLGLDWDEGPVYQSQRGDFYARQLDKLAAAGLVYPCWCSRAELQAAAAPHLGQAQPVYGGRCRALSAARRARLAAGGPSPALRVKAPDLVMEFTDGVYGPQARNLAREAGDFILRRSDGVYAYQLAVAADDLAMGVTEVVRGRDLLDSTPRQLWLMGMLAAGEAAAPPAEGGKALPAQAPYPPRAAAQAPCYSHTPLLLAPDGRRLAKRDRDLDLGALRARYAGPQPILGKLAWLAGLLPAPQPLSAAELVPLFTWEKVTREDITIEEGMF